MNDRTLMDHNGNTEYALHDRRHPSHLRGHPIELRGDRWVYIDTGEPTAGNPRPCGRCGKRDTPEGHDACLGALPGVLNACCGHGRPEESYVQFASGVTIRKFQEVDDER